MNKYFSLVRTGKEANINIYGDITSYAYEPRGEVSAYNLSRQLEEMQDVDTINVYISSYGGEVKEGLAIYNALKNHKAKVRTYCDSFACSIASVIFMAGDERIMSNASLLMIHNAWTTAVGNADELRKQAKDLDVITSASVAAYMERATITEKELRKLMDAETWITPEKAVEYGFATSILEDKAEHASQNVKMSLMNVILAAQDAQEREENGDGEEVPAEKKKLAEGNEKPRKGVLENGEPEEHQKESETAAQKMSGFFNAIFKEDN